jgi:very-short-patch-repair endonuclease
MGLILTSVKGAYDRGGKRTNEIEAKAVVEAVVRHIVEQPDLSLGIVTFSISQRELIDDLLEVRRRESPDLESFMQRTDKEPLFIKNLENVQGDERDVIFISIGYGPRIAGSGLDSMSFGPVSSDGGERRLNVLFTRARFRTEVFSSFGSSDIDLARAKTEGARILKRFLHYAETGHIGAPEPTGGGFDSPFEEAVARAIEDFGHRADSQVGSAGYKIDLAIQHPAQPGRYILAVECDGAAYHSARWARERDRLRQEVLEQRGWSFHRIWSTDWFRNPSTERAKLLEAIEKAKIRHSN